MKESIEKVTFTVNGEQKDLTRKAKKEGGKNNSAVDGFWEDDKGKRYFIKAPSDQREFFTELFAGLVLKQLLSYAAFEDKASLSDFGSIITAGYATTPTGQLVLIQDCVDGFVALYTTIGTGNRSGKDRNPISEILFQGKQYTQLMDKSGSYEGLTAALMYSILLGDYSVHSGNIFSIDVRSANGALHKKYGRIDFGAAFRYFFDKDNNVDVYKAKERKDSLHKDFTKNYTDYFVSIPGITEAIAEKATVFCEFMTVPVLEEAVLRAIQAFPKSFFQGGGASDLKIRIANYMYSEKLAEAFCGNVLGDAAFAKELAGTMIFRAKQMAFYKHVVNSKKVAYKTIQLEEKEPVVSREHFHAALLERIATLTPQDCQLIEMPTAKSIPLELLKAIHIYDPSSDKRIPILMYCAQDELISQETFQAVLDTLQNNSNTFTADLKTVLSSSNSDVNPLYRAIVSKNQVVSSALQLLAVAEKISLPAVCQKAIEEGASQCNAALLQAVETLNQLMADYQENQALYKFLIGAKTLLEQIPKLKNEIECFLGTDHQGSPDVRQADKLLRQVDEIKTQFEKAKDQAAKIRGIQETINVNRDKSKVERTELLSETKEEKAFSFVQSGGIVNMFKSVASQREGSQGEKNATEFVDFLRDQLKKG